MDSPIGVIGGLSPYSTILYYKFLVEVYREKKGVDPKIVIYSIPVQEMCRAAKEGDRQKARELLMTAFKGLRNAGAKTVLLAANTPHIFIDNELLEQAGDIEFIDIREAVLRKLEKLGISKVGLLATTSTIQNRLYQDYLESKGYKVILPNPKAQERLQQVVEKLTQGLIPDSAKLVLATLVSELTSKGAQAILYGCTELSLLIGRVKVNRPIIDSLTEHVLYTIDKLIES
ncbi:MAG: amino acid racemase [Desulfurococcales archaeon]|nr:amino acid racemase [Desulfurococcales archaeon]MCE4626609.1 amino acid racemase [Desulfurococcales archaeon]